jgi:hypothetical protein
MKINPAIIERKTIAYKQNIVIGFFIIILFKLQIVTGIKNNNKNANI